jgi:glutathione S-transferase
MAESIVYRSPRSTVVNLVLTHKDVSHVFSDFEIVMGKAEHLALHLFNCVSSPGSR